MHLRVKELDKNDGQPWRIDWLGKAQRNEHVDSEPTIDVHLTRLIEGYSDLFSNKSLTKDTFTARVGLGQLPILTIGSIWNNGRCVEIPHEGKFDEVTINTEVGKIVQFNSTFSDAGKTNLYIPASHYPVQSHYSSLQDAPLWVFPGGEYRFLLIPHIELLRFYYVCSSQVGLYIWENSLDAAIDPFRSDILIGNDVRIYLRKEFYDHDAWLLARWFLSKKMQAEIASLTAQRRVSGANTKIGQRIASHINIGFPFTGTTKLGVVGKRIKVRTWLDINGKPQIDWAFLVLRLHSCNHPLPFRNVIVDRANNSLKGKNRDDEDLKPGWLNGIIKSAPALSEIPSNGMADEMPTHSKDEPNKEIQKTLLKLFQQRFSDLLGKELIKEEKEVQKYKNIKVIKPGAELVDHFGTGEGSHRGTSTAPIDIAHVPLKNPLPADLEHFIQVLDKLRLKEHVREVLPVPLFGQAEKSADDYIFHYPSTIRQVRSWHVVTDIPFRTRGVIIAKITLQLRTYYLLELERKTDKHATLVLRNDRYDAISDKLLYSFLLETAKNNRWPNADRFFELKGLPINHNEADTTERFANRIYKKLMAN